MGELPKLISFIQKSKNGAEWDLKRIWSLDKDVIYLYREIECRYDDIGNIHFGFMGAAAGYTVQFLVGGAGLYQLYSDKAWNYNPYLDDPRDSMMITYGYYLFWSEIT